MTLPYRHRQEMNGPFLYITVIFKLLNMSILLVDRTFYLSALMSSNRKKNSCFYKDTVSTKREGTVLFPCFLRDS